MSAYCFFNVRAVHDESKMDAYRQRVFATVSAYGGRYVVIGGEAEIVEGTLPVAFPVLIEFPDRVAAHRWYRSPEYREILPLRLEATEGDAVFLEGMMVPGR